MSLVYGVATAIFFYAERIKGGLTAVPAVIAGVFALCSILLIISFSATLPPMRLATVQQRR